MVWATAGTGWGDGPDERGEEVPHRHRGRGSPRRAQVLPPQQPRGCALSLSLSFTHTLSYSLTHPLSLALSPLLCSFSLPLLTLSRFLRETSSLPLSPSLPPPSSLPLSTLLFHSLSLSLSVSLCFYLSFCVSHYYLCPSILSLCRYSTVLRVSCPSVDHRLGATTLTANSNIKTNLVNQVSKITQ